MRSLAPMLLALALLFSAPQPTASATKLHFRRHEQISMHHRAQYNAMRTGWTPANKELTPRFGTDTSAELRIKPEVLPPGKPYKMALSFNYEEFQTAWLAVSDGKAQHLRSATITFTIAGDHIRGMSTALEYEEPPRAAEGPDGAPGEQKWPESLWLHYRFVEELEEDAAFALNTLFAVGSAASFAMVLYIGYDTMGLWEDGAVYVARVARREDSRKTK